MSEYALCQGDHCRPPDHGGPRRANGWPLCEVCEERVAENLRDIAEVWPDTEEALRVPEMVGGEKVSGSATIGLPLNEAVADARREALTTLAYWAQVVVQEAQTLTAPPFDLEHVGGLATWLSVHYRRLTRNYDEGVCISISADAHRLRSDLRRAAYPSGARRFPGRHERQLPCVEHGVNDQGERVQCPGTYFTYIVRGMDGFPDLRCSEDETHIMTPLGFRRLGRVALDREGSRRLMAAIVGDSLSATSGRTA